jgi:hypothetical protein
MHWALMHWGPDLHRLLHPRLWTTACGALLSNGLLLTAAPEGSRSDMIHSMVDSQVEINTPPAAST